MQILPAIDILHGKVVRLHQGRYDDVTYYSQDPVNMALEFAKMGYSFLHVIDLGGAKAGQVQIEREIKNILALGLDVQVGGGIRTVESAERYLAAGAKRIIIGTQALIQPSFIDELLNLFPAEALAVSVDVRAGKVALKGWLEEHTRSVEDVLQQLQDQGIRQCIVTDITRDGTLSGVNPMLYQPLVKPSFQLYAAGGISSKDDIEQLKNIGVCGAIIGKAFYEKNIRFDNDR